MADTLEFRPNDQLRVAKRLVLFESNAQCFYHVEIS